MLTILARTALSESAEDNNKNVHDTRSTFLRAQLGRTCKRQSSPHAECCRWSIQPTNPADHTDATPF